MTDILASVPACLWPVESFSQEEGISTSFLPCNAEYPNSNMWILPPISVLPWKRKKQKNVTLQGAEIREQRMGLFLGKMAE